MPRVPLQQLREQQKCGHQNEQDKEPASIVTECRRSVAASFKQNKNRARAPQRLIAENMEKDVQLVVQKERILDNSLSPTAAKSRDNKDHFSGTNLQKQNEIRVKAGRPLRIKEEHMTAVQNAETQLQRANPGRKLRLVLVESDTDGEFDATGNMSFHNEGNDCQNIAVSVNSSETLENQVHDIIVEADVHHVKHTNKRVEVNVGGQDSVTSDMFKYESSERAKEAENHDLWENREKGQFGGARPKERNKEPAVLVPSLLEKTTDKKKAARQKKRKEKKKANKFKQKESKGRKQKESNWGEEESSESDRECDWDGGDISLVSRQ